MTDDGEMEIFCDPISFEIMVSPQVLPCGHTFDEKTIQDWLRKSHSCPTCKAPCNPEQVKPNYTLRHAIESMKNLYSQRSTSTSTVASSSSSSSSMVAGPSSSSSLAAVDSQSSAAPAASATKKKRRKKQHHSKSAPAADGEAHSEAIGDEFKNFAELKVALRKEEIDLDNDPECIQLIVGIDFTVSNINAGKESFGGRSLHDVTDGLPENPYIRVMRAIGRTLGKFDEDGRIPVFGFGDKKCKGKSSFSLKEKDGKPIPCSGMADAISAYRATMSQIHLSGPTNFAPLIDAAIAIVKETKEFHLLVIICDGCVTMLRETEEAVKAACQHPIAIMCVGVGDGPFDDMKLLDDMDNRLFDNFQFVHYDDVIKNAKSDADIDEQFMLAAMMELPQQLASMKKFRLR